MSEDPADRLVARAIESVLDQVPGSLDTSLPEGGVAKLQPWAETAAPVGRNKRPLDELLGELEARVSAAPDARATLPRTRHPALTFFDRFGRGGRGQAAPDGTADAGDGGSRRRRRRRGGGGVEAGPRTDGAATTPVQPGERSGAGRRRSRRGRGGRPAEGGARSGAAPQSGGAPTDGRPALPTRPPGDGPASPSRGGRRRRGRRGRGPGSDRPAPG
jgi:hypothetical protein